MSSINQSCGPVTPGTSVAPPPMANHSWGHNITPPPPPNPWDIERRVILLEQSTKDIKDELGKVNNNLSKIMWIILSAIIIAILNLVLRGSAV